jgi:hypothetical protein
MGDLTGFMHNRLSFPQTSIMDQSISREHLDSGIEMNFDFSGYVVHDERGIKYELGGFS